jgi:hypothetical protein
MREGSISRQQIRSGTRDAPVGSGAPGRRAPRWILPCGTAQQCCPRRAGLPDAPAVKREAEEDWGRRGGVEAAPAGALRCSRAGTLQPLAAIAAALLAS